MDTTVLENKTALIIEDDAHSLLALASLLDGFHIRYKRNTTGSGAVAQARRLKPDIIMIDMNLPSGDPFQICADLHGDPTLGNVPIIAMADDNIIDDLRSAVRQANFAGLISKPFEQHEFSDLLQQLMSHN